MKRISLIAGVVLFLAGIVALIHPSFDYNKRDEVAKIGPITATVEKSERATVPVAATVSLLVAGLVFIVVGVRSKS